MDQRRTLAAQFERDRCQVLAGRLHNQTTHALRPREKQTVERESRKIGRNAGIACDHGRILGRIDFSNHRFDEFGRLRREFRWLHHDVVPGGDGPDHRADAEKQRIIPGG